jgi:hypothetical protein
MERIYNTIKLFKTKKFENKKEEILYWNKFNTLEIDKKNTLEYKQALIDDFEEKLHVIWSRQFVSKILSLILLGFTIFLVLFFSSIVISFSVLLISFLLLMMSKKYEKKFNKIGQQYAVTIGFLNLYIEFEFDIKFTNNNIIKI